MNTLLEKLKEIDTPTLSNAIEKLAVRNRISGFADRRLRCLFPELGIMCGTAVTAQVESVAPDTLGGLDEGFLALCEALETYEGPSVIAFQEISGHPDFAAHCGEVMTTIFQKLGGIGLVSDCAVRDMAEVRSLKFHYFATGQVASHGSFRVVRAQVPITVCGLQIAPGDLLHGDENGLILVPAEGRDQLPRLADEVRQAESALLDFVNSERFTVEGLRKRVTH
ncbi:MAG: RraA family protein [Candidatus Latescibacterota bacterium]